jgi:methylaspartate mutase epsilon subunit
LLAQAAHLAVETGAERLIVKTTAESVRIPTVQENIEALEHAAAAAEAAPPPAVPAADAVTASGTYQEAAALVEAVLALHPDLSRALLLAFRNGYLDIPYCLHPDNRGSTRSYIDADGWLRWEDTGALPIGHLVKPRRHRTVTSAGLLADLTHVRTRADTPGTAGRELPST